MTVALPRGSVAVTAAAVVWCLQSADTVLRTIFQYYASFGDRTNTVQLTDFKWMKIVRDTKLPVSVLRYSGAGCRCDLLALFPMSLIAAW